MKPKALIKHKDEVVKWDPYAKTVRRVAHNKPDIIWEREKEIRVIEIGCPLDKNVVSTEDEKTKKYGDLASELRRLKPEKTIKIIPIVIGNIGLVSVRAKEYLDSLELDLSLQALQKTAAIQTIRIINSHKPARGGKAT